MSEHEHDHRGHRGPDGNCTVCHLEPPSRAQRPAPPPPPKLRVEVNAACDNPDHMGLCMPGHVHRDHVADSNSKMITLTLVDPEIVVDNLLHRANELARNPHAHKEVAETLRDAASQIEAQSDGPKATASEVPEPGEADFETVRAALRTGSHRVVPYLSDSEVDMLADAVVAVLPTLRPDRYRTPAEIMAQRAAGWPDFHPEDYCHRCGNRNLSWFVHSDVWNHVMRSGGEGDNYSIVCPQCFSDLAGDRVKSGRGVAFNLTVAADTRSGAVLLAAVAEATTALDTGSIHGLEGGES